MVVKKVGNLCRSHPRQRERGYLIFGEKVDRDCFIAASALPADDVTEKEKLVRVKGDRWVSVPVTVVDGGDFRGHHVEAVGPGVDGVGVVLGRQVA